jgi:Na+-translocating ferredoxin:NAD+ oxidoreductase RnfD subunit
VTAQPFLGPVRSRSPAPFVLPHRNDPRLKLAVVIVSLQVLGQTVLGFKVSIAQILVSVLVCAAAEVAIGLWRRRAFIWPASALLTGNSVAFILRTPGTRHGDWWSLNGIEFFIAAALLGLLSKYLITAGGRHLYNPSNLGLVGVFLLAGAAHVYPQYLWWGDLNPPVLAALAVILLGGLWVLWPLRRLPMVAAFLLTFTVLIGWLAASGGCFNAAWSPTAVCGSAYWLNICFSPELLVFVFFMITDPQTAPTSPRGRLLYGAAVAAVAAAMIATQPAEYGVKVALLSGLTVVCSLVPLIDRLAAGGVRLRLTPRFRTPRAAFVALVAVAVIVAVPLATVGLASDPLVLASDGNPTLGIKPTQP